MLNPGRAWRKREDQTVARKTYSEEFRRDAVELYRTTPGATVVGIAGDLGIMDGTLPAWRCTGVLVAGPRRQDRRTRRPSRNSLGSGPGSPSWRLMRGSSTVSGTSCGRRRSISPGRRAGDPLPVRRRPPERLRGGAAVSDRGDRPVVVLRVGRRR